MAVSRSRYLVSSAGTFSRVELQNETVSLFFNATEFGERPWTRLRLTVERPGIAARTYSAQHECQFTNNHIVRFSESVRIPVSPTFKNWGGLHFISILRGAGASGKSGCRVAQGGERVAPVPTDASTYSFVPAAELQETKVLLTC